MPDSSIPIVQPLTWVTEALFRTGPNRAFSDFAVLGLLLLDKGTAHQEPLTIDWTGDAVGRQVPLLGAVFFMGQTLSFGLRAFLERRPDGVIVQLGCGLETAYYRCDNGKTRWYAVDLPHVVEYRRELLPRPERETCLAGDAFAEDWIRQIRADAPILVTAGGLFHYFEEAKVLGLFRTPIWSGRSRL